MSINKTREVFSLPNVHYASFLKGIGVRIDYTLEPMIKAYKINNVTHFKHIKLTSMDIDFSINIMLPKQMGIGKHSSIGAGILTRKNK